MNKQLYIRVQPVDTPQPYVSTDVIGTSCPPSHLFLSTVKDLTLTSFMLTICLLFKGCLHGMAVWSGVIGSSTWTLMGSPWYPLDSLFNCYYSYMSVIVLLLVTWKKPFNELHPQEDPEDQETPDPHKDV